jgi:hypothetical protein
MGYEPLDGAHLPFRGCIRLQDKLLRRESALIHYCTFVFLIVLRQFMDAIRCRLMIVVAKLIAFGNTPFWRWLLNLPCFGQGDAYVDS